MTLHPQDIPMAFERMRTWVRAGERAVNKPLLLLMALGRVQRGEPRKMSYSEGEEALRDLLVRFGPPRQAPHPDLAFWRLQGDGLWEVSGPAELAATPLNGQPPMALLRQSQGGFPADIHASLVSDPTLIVTLATRLLETHFPAPLRAELARSVRLSLELGAAPRSAVSDISDHFRLEIVHAYGCRCAVCGFGGHVGGSPVGVEAARVRWDGPEAPDNGLCLCTLHVGLFDRGLFTLDQSRILVSSHLVEWTAVPSMLGQYHGQTTRGPVSGFPRVREAHEAWHRDWVFRGPERASPDGP